ncbi:MAG: type II toxin-antitoxin system Phd/YefM family antitoxin [Saccharothrix sp.]|nr:type II toxin-antitoxin system Phd/YefM family antitoxin [Saccharothrix sp.]
MTCPEAATAAGWDLTGASSCGVAEARKHLGDLIQQAAEGRPQVLRRHRTPVAVLLPAGDAAAGEAAPSGTAAPAASAGDVLPAVSASHTAPPHATAPKSARKRGSSSSRPQDAPAAPRAPSSAAGPAAGGKPTRKSAGKRGSMGASSVASTADGAVSAAAPAPDTTRAAAGPEGAPPAAPPVSATTASTGAPAAPLASAPAAPAPVPATLGVVPVRLLRPAPATLRDARAMLPDLVRTANAGTPTVLSRGGHHALLTTPDGVPVLGWDPTTAPVHGLVEACKHLGGLVEHAVQGRPQVLRRDTTALAVLLPATADGIPLRPPPSPPTTRAPLPRL